MLRPLLAAALVAVAVASAGAQDPPAKGKAGPLIGHMVYFKLKDGSPAGRQKMVDACDKYLSKHDGVVFYSAGPIAAEFKRDVNVTDWDVALHLVFADKAAHDRYQDHPDHEKFIAENKDGWAAVRVFDSELKSAVGGKKDRKKDAK
ncbi:MAG TPA: Dabb family protein [Urbifossiella sp.]|nr:Dabb family protein [Urbifossiella sp.]